MKMAAVNNRFDSSMEMKSRGFEITANAKMFKILSSSIYKYKELAIVREIIANALDAHVRAGTALHPIEIHLPTLLECYFEVKDFGTGLSEEDIYRLYTTYGSSDKTGSNDEIGGFGLGSKSPFAYTDQFTIESRFNGVLTRYHAYIDKDDLPNIGKVSETPTEEHNGLTVHIPVAGDGIMAFRGAYLQLDITTPVKLNIPLEQAWPPVVTTLHTDDVVVKVRDKKESNHDFKNAVIMGIVRYPLDSNIYEGNSLPSQILRSINLDIHAPIGHFEISVSRESLAYTDTVKKRLESILINAVLPLISAAIDKIDTASDIWQAKRLLSQAKDSYFYLLRFMVQYNHVTGPKLKQVEQLLAKVDSEPTWNGKPLWRVLDGVGIKHLRQSYRKRQALIADEDWYDRSAVRLPSGEMVLSGSNKYKTEIAGLSAAEIRKLQGTPCRIFDLVHASDVAEDANYWIPEERPYTGFFKDNPHLLPARIFVGDRVKVHLLVQSMGMDPDKLIEVPKQVRAKPNRTKGELGSFEYQIIWENPKYFNSWSMPERLKHASVRAKAKDIIEADYKTPIIVGTDTELAKIIQHAGKLMDLDIVTFNKTPKSPEYGLIVVPASHGRTKEALVDYYGISTLSDLLKQGTHVNINQDLAAIHLVMALYPAIHKAVKGLQDKSCFNAFAPHTVLALKDTVNTKQLKDWLSLEGLRLPPIEDQTIIDALKEHVSDKLLASTRLSMLQMIRASRPYLNRFKDRYPEFHTAVTTESYRYHIQHASECFLPLLTHYFNSKGANP